MMVHDPDTVSQLTACYGSIYRTVDYDGFVGDDRMKASRSDYCLAVTETTKRGRLPHWVQYSEDLKGRFIAALGSIQPTQDQPYPLLNVPEPITSFADLHDDNALMWGDAGTLYLSIDSRGRIDWTVQCY